MGVVRRFIEDNRSEFPDPTCKRFESKWVNTFRLAHGLIRRGDRRDCIMENGLVLLTVYPKVVLNLSPWFEGGCSPFTTTLLVKNPDYALNNFGVGTKNGIAVGYGDVAFAVNTGPKHPQITRPVARGYRQELFNLFSEFTRKFGPGYNNK